MTNNKHVGPTISFAHEVDGPWRLELNGITISRHGSKSGLEDAIASLRKALAVSPASLDQPRHDDGSAAPEDTIAKAKRILRAVDDYHDNPTQGTRSDLRHVIYEQLEAAALAQSQGRQQVSNTDRARGRVRAERS